MLCEENRGQEKSQKLDEGVSQASDWRSRLELLESASPVAFADIRATHRVHAEFQSAARCAATPKSTV